MNVVLLGEGKGVAVIVGLATHLDGCLYVKRQCLILLVREGRGGEREGGREGEGGG